MKYTDYLFENYKIQIARSEHYEKIRATLSDFEPRWDARRGVIELVEAYRKADLTPEVFEGPRYQRVAQLTELVERGEVDDELRRVSPGR